MGAAAADGTRPVHRATEDQLRALKRRGEVNGDTPLRSNPDAPWTTLGVIFPNLRPAPPPGKWSDMAPRPWRRYLARFVDNLVLGTLVWMVIGTVLYIVAPATTEEAFAVLEGPAGRFLNGMLTLAAALPAIALVIGLTGVSPGKWIFGVRVTDPEGRPIGVPAAFKRELKVWIYGMGAGLPLVSLWPLIGSYARLRDTGTTHWDLDQGRVVSQRPDGALQTTLLLIFVPLVILAVVGLQFL
jgi:uncharacterized RDD family membrane protein YckC